MYAAVMREVNKLTVESVRIQPPGRGEVQVRMTASGVCHSDQSALNGDIPLPPGAYVLGHEGVGVVQTVGDGVTSVAPGDTVIMATPTCGWCYYCTAGQPTLCERPDPVSPRLTSDDGESLIGFGGLGTFSEVATFSHHSVIPVTSSLPHEQLALIGCALVTGVGAVMRTAQVAPGSSVVVVGVGGVGQAVVQGARLVGADRIIAVDPVPMKRELAARFGATDVVDPSETDPVAAVHELTSGRGADYCFEVVGRAETISQAWTMARRGGTIVVIGMSDPAATFTVPTAEIIVSAKRLIGTYLGSAVIRRDFQMLADLAERGRLDLTSMVTQVIDLGSIDAAFAALDRGEIIRSVVAYG